VTNHSKEINERKDAGDLKLNLHHAIKMKTFLHGKPSRVLRASN